MVCAGTRLEALEAIAQTKNCACMYHTEEMLHAHATQPLQPLTNDHTRLLWTYANPVSPPPDFDG